MPARRRATQNPAASFLQFSNRQSPIDTALNRKLQIANCKSPKAFTLLELLVVIGIIVLLAAILVPVVSQVRMKGYVTSTQAQMQRIAAAIESYYHDFKAYPGPLPNSSLLGWPNAANNKMTMGTNITTAVDPTKITSSENLMLGLLGALSPSTDSSNPTLVTYTGFPPQHDVLGLNPVRPASYHYIDYIPEELSMPTGFAYATRTGSMNGAGNLAVDTAGSSNTPKAEPVGLDTAIPEFMDRIPDYMPILYIRANVGVQVTGTPGSGIVSSTVSPTPAVQYDASQLKPYGFNNVSYGSTTSDYVLPTGITVASTDAQWVAYFMNPNVVGQPRGKDGFILISAGADRLYGTKDDIIVTP